MYRVIIADDEPLIRIGLRETIEWDELGLEIAGEASNGLQALELIKSIKPKILITDIKMPLMDGLTLIKEICELGLNIKIIILSGYSDYEFLKEAIKFGVESYLLKPIDNDELISILKSTVDNIEKEIYTINQQKQGVMALRTNILNRLITNTISVNEYKEKAKFLEMDFCAADFIVAIAVIENSGKNEDIQSKMADVLNACQEIIHSKDLGTVFINIKGELVFLFNNKSDLLTQDLLNVTLMEIRNVIFHTFNFNVLIGVGSKVSLLEDIHKSYDTAFKCLNYVIVTNNDKTIYYSDIVCTIEANSNCEFKFNFQLIENYLKLGKKTELLKYIDEYFDELSKYDYISIEDIRNIVMQIVVQIINIFDKNVEYIDKVTNLLSFKYADILNLKKLNEFKDWTKSFCVKAVNLQLDNFKKKTSKVVEKTIKYVSDHYFENISLKFLADKLFINASYLGQIFKKEIGTSFTDYVNNYRVQEAKKLLINTNMKVYQVAEKVGFSDSYYFIKIFKKYTGINPSDVKKIRY